MIVFSLKFLQSAGLKDNPLIHTGLERLSQAAALLAFIPGPYPLICAYLQRLLFSQNSASDIFLPLACYHVTPESAGRTFSKTHIDMDHRSPTLSTDT
jgi:hypothetical protein